MKKKLLIAGGALLLVAFVLINIFRDKGGKIEVSVEKVERGRITQKVTGSGKIQPEVEVNISAHVSAKIVRLHVDEGDSVHTGQVLVELDRANYEALTAQARAGHSSAKANARSAKANADNARATFKRMTDLFDKGLASEQQLEEARTQFEVAQARYDAANDQVEQARASLDRALDDLAKTTLLSPKNGTVTRLNKEEGEIALGSQFQEDVIMVVADLSRMEVVTEIDENDVNLVELADSADISIDAFQDTSFRGGVTEIGLSAVTTGLGSQEEVTNYVVRVAVNAQVEGLRPGMSATVDIFTESREDVIRIPIQAVTIRSVKKKGEIKKDASGDSSAKASEADSASDKGEGDKKADKDKADEMKEVVFVHEDGKVKQVQIKTGISDDTHIEVVSGLEEGQEIVVGSYRAISKQLKDGSRVKLTEKKGKQDKKK